MRIWLILLSGLFLGIIFTLVINIFYLSKHDTVQFDKNIYEDGDKEEDEINRVVIHNNKMSIKMDKEDIESSGIKFNSFDMKMVANNESIRALSIPNISFIEMVNEYDELNIKLQIMNEELNYIKLKFDRLNELYNAQGSVALKDIEKVQHEIKNTNFSIAEIMLKIKNLLHKIEIKFGDLIVKDIKTNRNLYSSLINKNASFILLEDIKINNSYLIDDVELTFLTYSIDNKSLIGNVGLYYVKNKYYTPNQKLIAVSSSGSEVAGFLIPESALVYFQGQIWVYIYDEIESIFTRELISKIINKTNNEVFIPFEISNAKIVVEGSQILLAEEFRSQIMREDDD